MTETETETVEPAAEEVSNVEEEDSTPLALYTWGLSGAPVAWAPVAWAYSIATIRRANTGQIDVAAVQAALDADFPDAGYVAEDVALAHPPVGHFTVTVDGLDIRVDLAGDEDLLLPDENVVWYSGDGATVRDAGGYDYTYAAAGTYPVRLEVLVGGAVYTETQDVEVAPLEADPTAGSYNPYHHTVDEVLAYAAEHPDEVAAIRAAESKGKKRVGILDHI